MRIITVMVLGVLGLVGIAFSAISVLRLPLADIGTAVKTVVFFVVCAGGFFSLWSALRERWPALRESSMPGRPSVSVAEFIVFFLSLIGIAVIVIIADQIAREPEASGAFQLGLLFFISLMMSFGAWAACRGRRM